MKNKIIKLMAIMYIIIAMLIQLPSISYGASAYIPDGASGVRK